MENQCGILEKEQDWNMFTKFPLNRQPIPELPRSWRSSGAKMVATDSFLREGDVHPLSIR